MTRPIPTRTALDCGSARLTLLGSPDTFAPSVLDEKPKTTASRRSHPVVSPATDLPRFVNASPLIFLTEVGLLEVLRQPGVPVLVPDDVVLFPVDS
jgi:hypothetical protein